MMTHTETQSNISSGKLNSLRAAVLGANDGIVSVSSVIFGVAGAYNTTGFIVTAGVAALVAGALSMAVGEYISVSAQRDSEKALLEKERFELDTMPEQELAELTAIYEGKGLSKSTAKLVADELTARDVFAAHVDAELKIDPNNLTNPWHAAYASGAAFFCGAIIPVIAIIFSPERMRIPITFLSVVVALMITGFLSAKVGGAKKLNAVVRVVFGGILAMVITYAIGKIFGVTGI
jgi:VIT1/CCC1 family predicted Fe2+/Mn2+ transporter